MTNIQKRVIYTAIVDALVTIATLLVTMLVKDPALSQAMPGLIVSIQAIAIAVIAALTATEAAAIKAESNERMAITYERSRQSEVQPKPMTFTEATK